MMTQAKSKNVHEEVQQWDISPRFPVRLMLAVLFGALIGLAFGYFAQNLIWGAAFGFVVGAVAGMALHRRSGRKSSTKADAERH